MLNLPCQSLSFSKNGAPADANRDCQAAVELLLLNGSGACIAGNPPLLYVLFEPVLLSQSDTIACILMGDGCGLGGDGRKEDGVVVALLVMSFDTSFVDFGPSLFAPVSSISACINPKLVFGIQCTVFARGLIHSSILIFT